MTQARIRPVPVLAGVLGSLFACYLGFYLFTTLTQNQAFAFGDFFALWSYPRLAMSHGAALLYDFTGLHDAQVALGMNPAENNPFPYPPTVLLILWPLGALPYGAALAVWIAMTFAVYAAAILAGDRRSRLLALPLALAPTTTISIVSGQSGFLAAALLIGGMRLAGSAPIAAGILLALLTYKPQLGLLVPVALLSARQWRCIAAACVTVALLIVASSALLGWNIWWVWIASLPGYQERFGRVMATSRLMPTVLTDLRSLGAPIVLARLAQGFAAALATLAVWLSFRGGPRALAIPLLVVCCLLATPHAFIYDLPMLTGAAVLFLSSRLEGGLSMLDVTALVAVFVCPAVMANSASHVPVGGAALLLFLAAILRRQREGTSNCDRCSEFLLEAVAARIIGCEPPAEALADPVRFLAYAFARATHEDLTVLRRFVTDDDLREALDHAPPGIIDPRSRAYWNAMMGRYPAPRLPMRRFQADHPPA